MELLWRSELLEELEGFGVGFRVWVQGLGGLGGSGV